MENYIKQKRATPGMVQASDLQMRPMSGTAPISTSAKSVGGLRVSSSRELHGYDGPMQFMMSPNNPDQILSTSALTSPNSEGNFYSSILFKLSTIITFPVHKIDLIEILPYELEDDESTPIEIISSKAIGLTSNMSTIKQPNSDYQLSGSSGGGGIMIADSSAIDNGAIKSRNTSAPVTPATTKGNIFY